MSNRSGKLWPAPLFLHYLKNSHTWDVWCGAKGQGYYQQWQEMHTHDLAFVTCHKCLEALVLLGEAAVTRILELDAND